MLDGELVYNRSLKESVFLVFDVLTLDGIAQIHRPFHERLEVIRNEIMNHRIAKIVIPTGSQSKTITKLIRKVGYTVKL